MFNQDIFNIQKVWYIHLGLYYFNINLFNPKAYHRT